MYNSLVARDGGDVSFRDPYCTAYKAVFDHFKAQLQADYYSEENLVAIAAKPYPVVNTGDYRTGRLRALVDTTMHPAHLLSNARKALTILAIGHVQGCDLRGDDVSNQDNPRRHLEEIAANLTSLGVYSSRDVTMYKIQDILESIFHPTGPSSFYFHVTSACNQHCSYCYLGDENKGGDAVPAGKIIAYIRQAGKGWLREDHNHGRGTLTHPDLRDVLNRLRELRENWQDLVRVYNAIKAPLIILRTNFTIELPDEELFLLGEAFDEIVVTVDGDKATHDSQRGVGTYNLVVTHLKRFLLLKTKCIVKLAGILSVTDARGDAGDALRCLAAQLGIRAKIKPIVPMGNAEQLKAISVSCTSWGILTPDEALRSGNFAAASSCGFGNTLDVRPDGTIWPCYAFHSTDYCLGEMDDDIQGLQRMICDPERLVKMQQSTVDTNVTCKACIFRYLCHGPCRTWCEALSFAECNPSPRVADCDNLKKSIKEFVHAALDICGIPEIKWRNKGFEC